MMAWMKDIAPKVLLRLAVGAAVFFVANIWYVSSGLYKKERVKFSPVAGKLDSAFLYGDVVYLGESSNTSFNPWTDTFGYSVSEFLQMYLPQNRVRGVSHDGYHVGLFSQMLGLMPEHWADSSRKTVVITVNMRSFGPSAMFNGNEASNQQEAIFYSHRMALLNRVFVSLHHYDSRDAREMERAKTQWFRTRDLRLDNSTNGRHYGITHGDLVSKGEECYRHNTVKWWLRDLQRQFAPVSGDADLARVMPMAEAYLKEFAFLLDEENPRVQALDAIVAKCKQEQVNVVFVLLIPNYDHAHRLFGAELTQLMDYNMDFLRKRFTCWEKEYNKGDFKVGYVDVQRAYGDWAGGKHYTDQWYPTEHVDAHIRQFIAQKTAEKILEFQYRDRIQTGVTKPMVPVIKPSVNNQPNWNIKMPLADTCLQSWKDFVTKHLR
jgi:bisphosphoglycerate-dependent phosphoglycerate mutase